MLEAAARNTRVINKTTGSERFSPSLEFNNKHGVLVNCLMFLYQLLHVNDLSLRYLIFLLFHFQMMFEEGLLNHQYTTEPLLSINLSI